jgi:acyl-CoA reductase-like NAD-dependent aldehyde dehydrogenase
VFRSTVQFSESLSRSSDTAMLVTGAPNQRITHDQFDPHFNMGALIARRHMESILRYIDKGRAERAKRVLGGKPILQESHGYFVEPTIFTDVTPDMTTAREEIVGPLLAVLSCATDC